MFGYLIPKSYKEALEFDKENNNTKWADATRDEMDCIKEQQVFTKGPRAKWDPQHKKILNAPPNHQKIRVNLIFAVKYNGRHKARLVADGSLTPEPAENIYAGVVSLRHLRLVIFLGQLNNLELWGADIGNAYLEAHTQEKLFIIGGAEFEELQGFILIFNKALYGLKSSGKRWAEKFYDIIKDMGYTPSKADPCVWMRGNKTLKCYEYLAIYVDDLCIAAQDPGQIIRSLKEDFKLKVKGDGPLSHHLGADYTRDKDNTLVCQPKKYIERLAESYHSMFKQSPPKNMRTPLDKNDHPELDDSELLKGDSIQHCLTMIGQLQRLVTLGRFDIDAQVTTMSRFRSAPRKGHLERLQRIYEYVLKTKHYSTRDRTEEPDYTYLPDMKHDWSYTVYGNTLEIYPPCSVSRCGNDTISEGKESTMQESQDKSKHEETSKRVAKLKTLRDESTTKKDNVESVMMCWESTESLAEKEHREEPEKMANKLVETTAKQKHEEEHVEPTLNTGNRLKISIEKFSWE